MASANVEFVRSIFEAWGRGDYSSTEWADLDIEFVFADGPTPGSWSGLCGMAQAVRDFLSAWEEWRFEVEEYRDLDDERVLVLDHYQGRGKRSGVEVRDTQAKGAHVFHIRGGKVTRHVHYFDRERALADLGLSPEAGSP
jgi:ketosteroid isomerase-like protein